jgi:PPOX class probable F420-dependent enzyme
MALTPATPADLGDEQYVLLTTYRRTGIGVSTPVWVARDGDALVVATPDSAGKAKRMRGRAKVTLQACGALGKPRRGSAPVAGRAAAVPDDAVEEEMNLLDAKYGIQYRATRAAGLFGRPGHVAVFRITAP